MYFGYNKDDERVDMSTKDTIVIAERMKIIGDMDLKKKKRQRDRYIPEKINWLDDRKCVESKIVVKNIL